MYKIDGEEVREIMGPKQAFFIVPDHPCEPVAEGEEFRFQNNNTNFTYTMYARGMHITREMKDDGFSSEDMEAAKTELKDLLEETIRSALLAAKYIKHNSHPENMQLNPGIVWRKEIEFQQEDSFTLNTRLQARCRVAIIPPQDVDRVFDYLEYEKEYENSPPCGDFSRLLHEGVRAEFMSTYGEAEAEDSPTSQLFGKLMEPNNV